MRLTTALSVIAIFIFWSILSACSMPEEIAMPTEDIQATASDITNTTEPSATEVTVESEETVPAQSETWTPAPTITPDPYILYGIYWSAGFETGDLSEYTRNHGEFIQQSSYGSYQIVTGAVKDGNYAVGLTIDTSPLSRSQSAASYLFYYDTPDQGYYSAWLYIPEEITPLSWWNIWQWKSTYNGNSDESIPMWMLDLTSKSSSQNELTLTLVYRPDNNSFKEAYTNEAAVIPKGEWVHISTYYKKSIGTDGAVGVWINGEEIFYLENVNTAAADNNIYWSINNYTNNISPSPATIYFDDVIISAKQIDPEMILP